MMNRKITKSLFLALVALFSAEAFAPVAFSGRRVTSQMVVVDVDSETSFDKTIKSAGSSLVVIDYSTTWCGPCKVIAPKFEEMSEKYPDAVFLKVGQTPMHAFLFIFEVTTRLIASVLPVRDRHLTSPLLLCVSISFFCSSLGDW
jgi:thiol-disulfide isomerase/thioredoxin